MAGSKRRRGFGEPAFRRKKRHRTARGNRHAFPDRFQEFRARGDQSVRAADHPARQERIGQDQSDRVELLAALAGGTPFNEITDVGRGGTFEVRGGLRSCPRFGKKSFHLRFNRASITFDDERNQAIDYSIEIALHGKHEVQLSAENLKIGNRVFFYAKNHGGEILDVGCDNFSRGSNPSCQVSAVRSVLSRYEEIINLSAVLFALQQEDDPEQHAKLRRITKLIYPLISNFILQRILLDKHAAPSAVL